jgi:hypothetical protein
MASRDLQIYKGYPSSRQRIRIVRPDGIRGVVSAKREERHHHLRPENSSTVSLALAPSQSELGNFLERRDISLRHEISLRGLLCFGERCKCGFIAKSCKASSVYGKVRSMFHIYAMHARISVLYRTTLKAPRNITSHYKEVINKTRFIFCVCTHFTCMKKASDENPDSVESHPRCVSAP